MDHLLFISCYFNKIFTNVEICMFGIYVGIWDFTQRLLVNLIVIPHSPSPQPRFLIFVKVITLVDELNVNKNEYLFIRFFFSLIIVQTSIPTNHKLLMIPKVYNFDVVSQLTTQLYFPYLFTSHLKILIFLSMFSTAILREL